MPHTVAAKPSAPPAAKPSAAVTWAVSRHWDVPDYLSDPATRETLLRVDELDALIAQRGRPLRQQSALLHFLHRVRNTMKSQQREFALLHRQVSQISASAAAGGQPTTLDPASAIPFMSDKQLAELMEPAMRRKWQQLEGLIREVAAARKVVQTRVNAIKSATLAIAEDPNIDAETKQKILALLARETVSGPLIVDDNDVVQRLVQGLPPSPTASVVPGGNIGRAPAAPPTPAAANQPQTDSAQRRRRIVDVEDSDETEDVEIVSRRRGRDDSLEGLFT